MVEPSNNNKKEWPMVRVVIVILLYLLFQMLYVLFHD